MAEIGTLRVEAAHALDAAYDATHALLLHELRECGEDAAQDIGHMQLRLRVLESLGATRPDSSERRIRDAVHRGL